MNLLKFLTALAVAGTFAPFGPTSAEVPKQPLLTEETSFGFISPFKMACRSLGYVLPNSATFDEKVVINSDSPLTSMRDLILRSGLRVSLEVPHRNDQKINGLDIAVYNLDESSGPKGADFLLVYGRRLPFYTRLGSFAATAKVKLGFSLESDTVAGVTFKGDVNLETLLNGTCIKSVDIRPGMAASAAMMAEYYPSQWLGVFVEVSGTKRARPFGTMTDSSPYDTYSKQPVHVTIGLKSALSVT